MALDKKVGLERAHGTSREEMSLFAGNKGGTTTRSGVARRGARNGRGHIRELRMYRLKKLGNVREKSWTPRQNRLTTLGEGAHYHCKRGVRREVLHGDLTGGGERAPIDTVS